VRTRSSRHVATGDLSDELLQLRCDQTVERDALERSVAAKLGQRAGGRRRDIGGANGAEHHEVGEPSFCDEMSDERERGAVGPLEVVDHQERRAETGQ
jgi:hypothetical protein